MEADHPANGVLIPCLITVETIDQSELQEVRDLIEGTDSDIVAFCRVFKIEAIPDLRKHDLPRALNLLRQKKARAAQ